MGVALCDNQRILSAYELLDAYPHAVELSGAVKRVLASAETSLDALSGVIVDIGPGSFTGLRIGLSFVKGLSFGRDLPLVGVSSLDVLAAGFPYTDRLIVPVLDAKQKNVYGSAYRLDRAIPKKEVDYFLGPIENFMAEITAPAIFLGDGCSLYQDAILAASPDATFAPQDLWLPRVSLLGRLGAAKFEQGQRDDPAGLVPMYLYPLDCSVRSADRTTAKL